MVQIYKLQDNLSAFETLSKIANLIFLVAMMKNQQTFDIFLYFISTQWVTKAQIRWLPL